MKVNKIKFIGSMIFISILMDVVPYFGFLQLGAISITNLHIPAILTSIVLGPGYGAGVGIVFGIISMMRAVSRESTVLDILLQNPFISILPRILFPMISGYLFMLLQKLFSQEHNAVSVSLAAASGAFSNAGLVLGALYLAYPDELITIFDLPDGTMLYSSLVDAFVPNMIVEAVTAVLACLIAIPVIKKLSDLTQKIGKVR